MNLPRKIEYGQEGPNCYSKMETTVRNWRG
jgi:hypothetical protein